MKAKAIIKIILCGTAALILVGILALAMLFSKGNFFEERLNIRLPAFGDSGESLAAGGVEIEQEINRLEIKWAAGQIILRSYEGDTLCISEGQSDKMNGYVPTVENIPAEYAPAEEYRLSYRAVNGTLSIRADKSFWGGVENSDKVLLVLIPRGQLDELDIDAASAQIRLEHLTVTELAVDSASGDLLLEDCKIGSLEANSSSGDVKLQGSVERLEMDSSSGDLILISTTTPKSIDFAAASGCANLMLPASSEFSASMDSVSGKLNVNGFAVQMKNGNFFVGSGAARYEFETATGDVTIGCPEN